MDGLRLVQWLVLAVFAFNLSMLAVLIVSKEIHRRLATRHERLYSEYVATISLLITDRSAAEPISQKEAARRVFLDALIDVRNAVVGPEIETLRGLVDRYGVVESLARSLERRWPRGRRLRASVALAELGDESSARVLMKHVGDPNPEVRVQAARGLGRMHWTPAIDLIVERIGMEEPWVRSRFVDSLVNFGKLATWPLAAYIKVNHREEPEGAVAAIETLGVIGDRDAIDPIIEALYTSRDLEVILTSLDSLGHLGGPRVLEPMRDAAHAEQWELRVKGVAGLGELNDGASIPVMAKCLTDENFWVRRSAANALAVTSGGTSALLAALEGDDAYAADAAAEALIDRGDLVAARDRVATGDATDSDYRLLAFVDVAGEVA